MSSSPLSSVLSPAQIAIVQQARAMVAKPRVEPAAQSPMSLQAASPSKAQTSSSVQPMPRGRGQIINITV
jgi:hypothetical protein